jgi:hypothetical protein
MATRGIELPLSDTDRCIYYPAGCHRVASRKSGDLPSRRAVRQDRDIIPHRWIIATARSTPRNRDGAPCCLSASSACKEAGSLSAASTGLRLAQHAPRRGDEPRDFGRRSARGDDLSDHRTRSIFDRYSLTLKRPNEEGAWPASAYTDTQDATPTTIPVHTAYTPPFPGGSRGQVRDFSGAGARGRTGDLVLGKRRDSRHQSL